MKKKKINDDVQATYHKWTRKNLLDWIISLNNKKFEQYRQPLTSTFKQKEINIGSHIKNIKSDDLNKIINDKSDSQRIYNAIQKLLKKGKQIYCLKKEKIVNDALVIFMGIKLYPKNIRNLHDIINDYQYVKQTFKEEYGFNFFGNDFYKKWNKKDVIQYFQDIRDDTLLSYKNKNVQYNGLIICIAAHGSDHHVLCSDGKELGLKRIRSMFSSAANSNFMNLPKLFVVNCCRNDNEANGPPRANTVGTGYSATILGAMEGNYVFGSQLSKCLTQSFSEHKDKSSTLHKIATTAAIKLEKKSKQQQKLIITEHDLTVDDVIFEKHESSRPAIFEADNDDEYEFIAPKSYIDAPFINLSGLEPNESEINRLKEIGLKLNDIIILDDNRRGVLRYIGNGPYSQFVFGIELLDNHKGEHNGTVKGNSYFECGKDKGIFVTSNKIMSKYK